MSYGLHITLGFLLTVIIGCAAPVDSASEKRNIVDTTLFSTVENQEIIKKADELLTLPPQTITDFKADRSEGGLHDYYSEGSYWWPDPQCDSCPYIRKDGHRNPNNFIEHKIAIREFSLAVSTLTAAYRLSNDKAYAHKAIEHLKAWFVTERTMMNPSLLYAQAIEGISSGRGIGIIDSIVLIHVATCTEYLIAEGIIEGNTADGIRSWFDKFSTWLTTHPYGIKEQNNDNNHSTWWGAQVAAYARVAGRPDLIKLTQSEYARQLDIQMSADGRFQEELNRTKPFHYMNYNLRAWTCFAHVASTPDVNLWNHKGKNGTLDKALDFAMRYYKNPNQWTYKTELEKEIHPKSNDFLLFSYWGTKDKEYLTHWNNLRSRSQSEIETKAHLLIYKNEFAHE